MASDVNPVRCHACGNDFLQPFVCITCGAQKLYDATLLNAETRADAAEAKIATFVAQAKRIAGAHARDNDVHGEAAALYEAIAAAFTATASGPEGGDDAG